MQKEEKNPKIDYITETTDGRKVLYFKGKYEQRLEFYNGELIWWNCTCKFSSAFRFSQQFKNKKCKHIEKCLKTIKKNTTLLGN
ncbi:MAG: hypothetical protein ACOC5T_06350 [Elusimicrobiota bacterium]